MDSTYTDYNDLLFEVQADVAAAMDEIMEELAMPMAMQAVAMRWTTAPEDVKEALRKLRPDMYRMIVQMVTP